MRPHDTYAVERTALAWRRTGLTAAGTAAVLMTHAILRSVRQRSDHGSGCCSTR
ncbi:Hypothetical protein ERS075547_04218 [Mycobacteroides abscessus]|nr:Hypothetical protein ERS075547_04218 [Mycobacteroides abscessus]